MEKPKYQIGDTLVLKRRWFLFFRDYVLCEIVSGRYDEDFKKWRYCLKVGNQFKRFMMWEEELDDWEFDAFSPQNNR